MASMRFWRTVTLLARVDMATSVLIAPALVAWMALR
jgi:hypothetical protein